MRTGPLNKRIYIDRLVVTQNESNEEVREFVFWKKRWAAIEPLSGKQYFAAQQISSDITTRIRIRHLEGLNRKYRVRYERSAGSPTVTDFYEVDDIIPFQEDRREDHLMCRKIDSQGFRVDGSNA